jgi:hypothetical protein
MVIQRGGVYTERRRDAANTGTVGADAVNEGEGGTGNQLAA